MTMSSLDLLLLYPASCPGCVLSPSTWDTAPGSRPGHILGAILLKKKWESIAIALPPSFDGTDKPRRVAGGAR